MFEHMVFTSPRGKQIVFDDFCKEDEYRDDGGNEDTNENGFYYVHIA